MRARPARPFILLAILALATLGLASCSRDMPTAARATLPSRAMQHRAEGHEIEGEVVVTLANGVSPAAVAASYDATVLEWESDERIASFLPGPDDDAASLLARLSTDPRVQTSETNTSIEPAESRQKSFAFDDGRNTPENVAAQPALGAVHAVQALAVSRGDGVRVAILDTGIDSDHPLLAGRVAAAYDFVETHAGAEDVSYGVDSNGDGTVDGAWGHGTHVAGIVASAAPGARLLVARVLDSDGQGDVLTVAAGIRWAVQNGAQVINLSLGALSYSSAIESALEYAEDRHILVIASAGNWGAALPQEFPARSDDATAVAATDAFAAPAPWTSYASYVAISAPGVAIRSAYPHGQYRQWSGTSMSAPFVSATAALLLAKHPHWDGHEVMRRITANATPLVDLDAAQVGKLGAGMLDMGAALAPDAPYGDEGAVTTLFTVRH